VCSSDLTCCGVRNRTCLAISIISFIVVITSIVLFAVSWDTIEPNEVGIVYNHNILHLETDLWYSGRHLVGLGKSYITFPITTQTLRFGNFFGDQDGADLVIRSQDGMVITLEASFQYKLSSQASDLVRLCLDFNGDYEKIFNLEFQAAVRDVASHYLMFDFFTKRADINRDIQVLMNSRLNVMYAECTSAEIVGLSVISDFADTIELTQVAVQNVQQVDNQLQIALVQADSLVKQAQLQAAIQLATANATASGIIAQAQSDAAAIRISVDAQIQAFQSLRRALNLTTSQELLSYMWVSAVQSSQAQSLVVGLKYPTLLASFLERQNLTIPK